MPENFGQGFRVKPGGDTSGGEGVAQGVKGVSFKAVPFEEPFVTDVQGVRLRGPVRSGEQIGVGRFPIYLKITAECPGQRNVPSGMIGFRLTDDDLITERQNVCRSLLDLLHQ